MRAAKLFLVLLAATLLTACGFQLRGAYSLPFDSLALALPETTDFYAQLKRTIEASSPTRVVSDGKQAQATLTVLGDTQQKNILSLNSSGRVREFQLVRTFMFRVSGPDRIDYIAPAQIVIRRDMTFSDSQVLAKDAEEVLIWRDIQNDLVQQLMRRLSAAKLQSAEES